ncbi:MAG: hypothetical protein GY832_34575 [Chloroflexi bacterium]|nr:hypothetical protein [Chloroflexota bacterium]
MVDLTEVEMLFGSMFIGRVCVCIIALATVGTIKSFLLDRNRNTRREDDQSDLFRYDDGSEIDLSKYDDWSI